MASVANAVLTEIVGRVSTQLGATFSEHTRAYDLDTLPSQELENGYSAIFEDAIEDVAKCVGKLRLTRTIIISVTYRTYTMATDNKIKTKLETVYDNEEAITLDLRDVALSSAQGRVLDSDSSTVRLFNVAEESYILNEIRFRCFYEVT